MQPQTDSDPHSSFWAHHQKNSHCMNKYTEWHRVPNLAPTWHTRNAEARPLSLGLWTWMGFEAPPRNGIGWESRDRQTTPNMGMGMKMGMPLLCHQWRICLGHQWCRCLGKCRNRRLGIWNCAKWSWNRHLVWGLKVFYWGTTLGSIWANAMGGGFGSLIDMDFDLWLVPMDLRVNLGWEVGPSVVFFARFILIDLCIDWTLYCNCFVVGKYWSVTRGGSLGLSTHVPKNLQGTETFD